MVDSFLRNAIAATWASFPRKTVTFVSGDMLEGVFAQTDEYDEKDFGGYRIQDSISLTFKTGELGSNAVKGDTVTIDYERYRIKRIRRANVATTIEFEKCSI